MNDPQSQSISNLVSQPPQLRARELVSGMEIKVIAVLLVAGTLLGGPMALAWWSLASRVQAEVRPDGVYFLNEYPEQFIGTEAKFGLLAILFGISFGIAVWLLLRRWRGPAVVIGLALACLLCSVVGWQVGEFIETYKNDNLFDGVSQNATVQILVLQLQTRGMLLVQSLFAVITYAVCAAWTAEPALRPLGKQTTEPEGEHKT